MVDFAHVPVVLYACTSSPFSARRFLEDARRYAQCRDWTVVGEFADTDGVGPEHGRPEWQQAKQHVNAGRAVGIVTRYRSMAVVTDEEHDALTDWLAQRGAFLCCTWQPTLAIKQ